MINVDPSAPSALLISIKAVPGAKRDEVVGRLGDRLKIRISAPPENGKANKAIRLLLAREMNIRPNDIEIVHGHASPEKTVRITGVRPEDVPARWSAV